MMHFQILKGIDGTNSGGALLAVPGAGAMPGTAAMLGSGAIAGVIAGVIAGPKMPAGRSRAPAGGMPALRIG
jgi:surface antigen